MIQTLTPLERHEIHARIREAKVGDEVMFEDGETYIKRERGWRKKPKNADEAKRQKTYERKLEPFRRYRTGRLT